MTSLRQRILSGAVLGILVLSTCTLVATSTRGSGDPRLLDHDQPWARCRPSVRRSPDYAIRCSGDPTTTSHHHRDRGQ